MGSYTCEYTDMETAISPGKKVGMTEAEVRRAYYSCGDVRLISGCGKSWKMPDMAPLYVALGWEPPKEFVDDIMLGKITGGGRVETRDLARPERIGYLNPRDNLLPLEPSPNVPAGFARKRLDVMRQAESGGGHTESESLTPNDSETDRTGLRQSLGDLIRQNHREDNKLEPYRAGIMALADLEFQRDEQGNAVADLGTSEKKGSVIEQFIRGVAEYHNIVSAAVFSSDTRSTRAVVSDRIGEAGVDYLEREAARILRERVFPQLGQIITSLPLTPLNADSELSLEELNGKKAGRITVRILPYEYREHAAYLDAWLQVIAPMSRGNILSW